MTKKRNPSSDKSSRCFDNIAFPRILLFETIFFLILSSSASHHRNLKGTSNVLFVSSFAPPATTTVYKKQKTTTPFFSPLLQQQQQQQQTNNKHNLNSKSYYSQLYYSSLPTSTAAAASTTLRGGINSHYLTRVIFLRALSFVYCIAFLVAYHQNKALIGDNGITPAKRILDKAQQKGQETRRKRVNWIQYKKQNYKDPDKFVPNPDAEHTLSSKVEVYLKNTMLYRFIKHKLESSSKVQTIREVLWDRSDALDRPLFLSLFWLCKDRSKLNSWLDNIALLGLGTSLSILYMGAANVPLLLILWLCQRSFMSVGGPWYGYGWEPQLAELNFYALFLVPLLSLQPIPTTTPVPNTVIWAIRFYLFKIMMGAGLIKLRSNDSKWFTSWSTMDYFYETQPVPHFLTRYFHFMPKWWHRFEVGCNHFVELIAPWLMLVPSFSSSSNRFGRMCRVSGGVIQIVFQMILISSGNLSFLNWLTAVPALFCFDDAFLARFFEPFKSSSSASLTAYLNMISTTSSATSNAAANAVLANTTPAVPIMRKITTMLFGSLVFYLSIPVVQNLLSKRQLMNASFDKLRLVNTYGAFGVVSEEREELIISSAERIDGPWKEYEFKVKPGDIYRRPRWISPYHYRLDWQIWIASCCRSIERSPWMFRFLLKLLQRDEEVLGLLANDPWAVSSESRSNHSGDESKDPKGQEEDESKDPKGQEEEEDESKIPKGQIENENKETDQKDGTTVTNMGKPKYIRIDKYKYKFYRPEKGGGEEKPSNKGDDDDNSKRSHQNRKPYWVREYSGRFYPRQGVATEETLMDLVRR